jgi:hypothetical protein
MEAGGQESVGANIPLTVRVTLARAAVQVIADDAGVDMLHIKGEVVDTRLRPEPTPGSDVDALVRPVHVPAMHAALLAHGWRVFSTFELGSPFGHAQTYVHDMWGFFDLHRSFPGVRRNTGEAFELMWGGRREHELSGVRGWVPSITMQATLLVLNDARDAGGQNESSLTWIENPSLDADEIAALVTELRAHTAFAAALGTLESHRSAPDYALWRAVSQRGTRTAEWWGRIRAAETPGDAARLATRALLVNVEQLQHDLGRSPTKWEIAQALISRQAHAVREIAGQILRRNSS